MNYYDIFVHCNVAGIVGVERLVELFNIDMN